MTALKFLRLQFFSMTDSLLKTYFGALRHFNKLHHPGRVRSFADQLADGVVACVRDDSHLSHCLRLCRADVNIQDPQPPTRLSLSLGFCLKVTLCLLQMLCCLTYALKSSAIALA